MFCCSPTEFQGQDPNPGVASSWGYDSVLPVSRPARECGERIPFLSELRTRRKGVIFGSLAYKSRSWAFQQQWRPPRQRVTGKLHSLPLALAPTISIYMEWQGIWSDYSLCLWLMHLAAIFFFFNALSHLQKGSKQGQTSSEKQGFQLWNTEAGTGYTPGRKTHFL